MYGNGLVKPLSPRSCLLPAVPLQGFLRGVPLVGYRAVLLATIISGPDLQKVKNVILLRPGVSSTWYIEGEVSAGFC